MNLYTQKTSTTELANENQTTFNTSSIGAGFEKSFAQTIHET